MNKDDHSFKRKKKQIYTIQQRFKQLSLFFISNSFPIY